MHYRQTDMSSEVRSITATGDAANTAVSADTSKNATTRNASSAASSSSPVVMFSAEDVTKLLTPSVAMSCAERAFAALTAHSVVNPVRWGCVLPLNEKKGVHVLGHMPAYLPERVIKSEHAATVTTTTDCGNSTTSTTSSTTTDHGQTSSTTDHGQTSTTAAVTSADTAEAAVSAAVTVVVEDKQDKQTLEPNPTEWYHPMTAPGGRKGEGGYMATKVVSVFPSNAGTPYASHQGAILLFEANHGKLVCIADAHEVTAIRTAAASAVATRLLSRQNSTILALIGAGCQAQQHLDAIRIVRPGITEVRVWSRTRASAEEFVRRNSSSNNSAVAGDNAADGAAAGQDTTTTAVLRIVAVDTPSEAARDADIICTVTPSETPLLRGIDVAKGAHINAVGSCFPTQRELDDDCVVRARVFVDTLEACVKEPGDLVQPFNAGLIGPDHILGEIGHLLHAEENERAKAAAAAAASAGGGGGGAEAITTSASSSLSDSGGSGGPYVPDSIISERSADVNATDATTAAEAAEAEAAAAASGTQSQRIGCADDATTTSGIVMGRTSESDITLFKSVGAAVEDLCATVALYEANAQANEEAEREAEKEAAALRRQLAGMGWMTM